MVNMNMLIDRQLSGRPQNGSFDHNIPLMIFTSLLSINTGRILLENYIDDQNQKVCRGSTEDLQLFYGHPSGSCIFPFIFNETRYSSCTFYSLQNINLPISLCPQHSIKGKGLFRGAIIQIT